jgi:hypothetical protein
MGKWAMRRIMKHKYSRDSALEKNNENAAGMVLCVNLVLRGVEFGLVSYKAEASSPSSQAKKKNFWIVSD